MLFWEIKGTISGERAPFLHRWMYSKKSYAKNIEVLTYTLTDEQVSYMFTHPLEEIQQPSQKDLFLKNVYAVLRIRNLYNRVAEGRLSWSISGSGWSAVDVNNIPIHSNARKYGDIIISLGVRITDTNDTPPEPIIVKWDELYLYR